MYTQRPFAIITGIITITIVIIQDQPTVAQTSSPSSFDPRYVKCSTGNKAVLLAVMEYPPYMFFKNASDPVSDVVGVVIDYLNSAIQRCYQTCNIEFVTASGSKDFINKIQRDAISIALPITSTLALNLTWPLFKESIVVFHTAIIVSSRTLIVNKHHFNDWIRMKMLVGLLQAWPLFAFTFVLAGLSGVCIWILEWRSNSEEFKPSFSRGWFEGFWWAFVSMTTVGYGDKAPKTVFGRLFATVWILFGLVMVAVFTATATNAMTSYESGIEQAKVAVLASTDASMFAAQLGATVQKYQSFVEMYNALQARRVDAILIDHNVGAYHVSKLPNDDLRMLKSLESQVPYSIAFIDKEGQLIYNECFKTIATLRGTSHYMEKHSQVLKAFDYNNDFVGLFASQGSNSFLIIVSSIALGVILVIGIGVELLGRKFNLLNSGLCGTACCNKKTMVQELNGVKMSSSDGNKVYPMNEMPPPQRIYPLPPPPQGRHNADDHSLESLREELQRLRATMNHILDRLDSKIT